MELYRKYRPSVFKNVIGQEQAIRTLQSKLENGFPHALMLCGPSGVGKTTVARILKDKLECHDNDYNEINAAISRGIDTVRDIETRMNLSALNKSRIYYFDEAHQLNNPAQNALLKMLEDTPAHVYFFLASTDPEKISKTIQTRCLEIVFKPLSEPRLRDILHRVMKRESISLSEEIEDKIVKLAAGSGRKALVFLDQIKDIKDESEQMQTLQSSTGEANAFDIVKMLLWERRPSWSDLCKVLIVIKDSGQDPEGIRRLILANATTELLKANKNQGRAYAITNYFLDPYFNSGFGGLVNSCYALFSKG